MSALQFCVDVLKTGMVQGVGLQSLPDAWEVALGSGYLDDVQKNRMRRDYGLIELSFLKSDGEWACIEASIQVHRLKMLPAEDVVPDVLVQRYGKFESTVRMGDLIESLAVCGVRHDLILDRNQERHKRFSVEEAPAIIHVLANDFDTAGSLKSGDVWSISLPRDFGRRKAALV
ncbi:hypothetical protein HRW07_13210 [Streptomyces lunaelactis]|uniref:hypothetical protein n=1 Tax=Streptomyces lunaelactis TaxID=1535768 RepID=UPI001584E1F9|nr:hypothetical protein [Streptomyces lunaelactis]NUL04174.1 hypothetical protein [Streptomyces lunaelactis]